MNDPLAARPTLARAVARWIHAVDAAGLEAGVVEKAQLCLLDMIGVAAAANDLPWSRQAAQYAAAMGGNRATLIGSPARASVAEAAFANATAAHALVQEDMHTASVSHIGVVVWPTLLALAEVQRATGRALVAAGVVGYQVMARVGQALITKEVAQRFRPTGLVGAVGGAAAGARLLRLSEDETVNALALAANTAGGLNEWPRSGGGEMFFHPGFAARNAVTAVLLARAGAEASESALDGPAGLFAAYGNVRRETLDLGGEWEILAAYHKPVPACNYAQTPAQAALGARGPVPHAAPGEDEHPVHRRRGAGARPARRRGVPVVCPGRRDGGTGPARTAREQRRACAGVSATAGGGGDRDAA
jgi:2-methylcitrate dehydratase PrpD